MRYIYYIVAILVLAASLIVYQLIADRPSEKDAALIINDRIITRQEFQKLYDSREPHLKEKNDFINALIAKELLIQEAKKLGIDREESFRKSIQNFYEQSLIKILIDRKLGSLTITVGDDELKRYLELLNKRLWITVFTFDDAEAVEKGDYRSSEKRNVKFEDLSRDLKESVASLKEGEKTAPIHTGQEYIVVRLDKSEGVPREISDAQAARIKEMLIEEKKAKILDEWIENLTRSCTVTNQLEQNADK